VARYIGLDVHSASCTMVVVGASGKKLACHVVETNAKVLVELIKGIPRPRYLCLEEGTQSGWLHETLSPHTDKTVVTVKTEKRGCKDDERDALDLANRMRTNSIDVQVYKDVGRYGRLRELARVHQMQVNDVVRIQNRIKSLFRSRALAVGDEMYDAEKRESCIKKLPTRSQTMADLLLRQYDSVHALRNEAEKAVVREARKHPAFNLLMTIPGIAQLRSARLMAVVVTPHRFRSRQQFWKYCGFGVVKHSSANWEKDKTGQLQKHLVEQTRGLNRNYNHRLKDLFKGAAMTVIGQPGKGCPLAAHYTSMLEHKVDPDMAKLTLARQIAAITLALWKKEESYDPAKLKKTT
jgi:transposase